MGSRIRLVCVCAGAIFFAVAALTGRPGATVGNSRELAPAPADITLTDHATAVLAEIGSLARERTDEIAGLGDWYRTVTLHDANHDETASFRISPSGIVAPEDAEALEEFFSCRRTGKRRSLHPRLLAMLVDVHDRFEGHRIEVISGVRARPYGVRKSKHFVGRAIDLKVRGVRLRVVRDYLWRNHQGVGVGYYPHHGFVHMDVRTGEREAAWSAVARTGRYRVNPGWSRRARRQ